MDLGWDELEEWQRAKEHDARAFASIFDHHEARVFRHSLQLTRSHHDAEDVTAATFFELWRRREAVRLVAGSTLPWLLVTATNISRNTHRALRRYRVMLDRLPRGASVVGEVFQPRPALDDDGGVYTALRGLGRTDAALLVLTAVEGYSVKDASAAVGMSEGAGRVRLHRAKQRLRGQLRPIPGQVPRLKGGSS